MVPSFVVHVLRFLPIKCTSVHYPAFWLIARKITEETDGWQRRGGYGTGHSYPSHGFAICRMRTFLSVFLRVCPMRLRQRGAMHDGANAQAGEYVLARQMVVQVDFVAFLDALDAIEHAIAM